MKEYRLYTAGPTYTIRAKNLRDAKSQAEALPTMRRGWYITWVSNDRNHHVMSIFNSRGAVQHGALLITPDTKSPDKGRYSRPMNSAWVKK